MSSMRGELFVSSPYRLVVMRRERLYRVWIPGVDRAHDYNAWLLPLHILQHRIPSRLLHSRLHVCARARLSRLHRRWRCGVGCYGGGLFGYADDQSDVEGTLCKELGKRKCNLRSDGGTGFGSISYFPWPPITTTLFIAVDGNDTGIF